MTRTPYALLLFMLVMGGGLVALLLHPPKGFPLGPIPAAQGVLLFSMFLLIFLPLVEMRSIAWGSPRWIFWHLQISLGVVACLMTLRMPLPDLGAAEFLQRSVQNGPGLQMLIFAAFLAYALFSMRHRRLINWLKALSRIALVLAGLAAFALLLGVTGWTSPAMALWAGIIALGWAAASPWVQDQTRRYVSGRARVPALAFLAVAASAGAVAGLYATLSDTNVLRALFICSGAVLGASWRMTYDRRKQASALDRQAHPEARM